MVSLEFQIGKREAFESCQTRFKTLFLTLNHHHNKEPRKRDSEARLRRDQGFGDSGGDHSSCLCPAARRDPHKGLEHSHHGSKKTHQGCGGDQSAQKARSTIDQVYKSQSDFVKAGSNLLC